MKGGLRRIGSWVRAHVGFWVTGGLLILVLLAWGCWVIHPDESVQGTPKAYGIIDYPASAETFARRVIHLDSYWEPSYALLIDSLIALKNVANAKNLPRHPGSAQS